MLGVYQFRELEKWHVHFRNSVSSSPLSCVDACLVSALSFFDVVFLNFLEGVWLFSLDSTEVFQFCGLFAFTFDGKCVDYWLPFFLLLFSIKFKGLCFEVWSFSAVIAGSFTFVRCILISGFIWLE